MTGVQTCALPICRFHFRDGLMGGNLWFMGDSLDSALLAAERAHAAAASVAGVICPFPGGIAASGSKAGSKYPFSIASTYAEYCPTLKAKEGVNTRLPDGVASVMEIIINGRDLDTLIRATQAAILAAQETKGLIRIDRKSTRLNSSHIPLSRMPSSA